MKASKMQRFLSQKILRKKSYGTSLKTAPTLFAPPFWVAPYRLPDESKIIDPIAGPEP
jgi:hypothetical protein